MDTLIRQTPSRLYMPEIDGLRAFAFLLVFMHHLPFPAEWNDKSALLGRVHDFGWIGVDVFLVLSAYLLTRLAMREFDETKDLDILRFYIRRVLRIWPLYFFGLLLGFFIYPALLASFGYGTSKILPSIRDHLFPYMTFVGNFSYALFRETLGLYKSLWTVCLEEQFYVIFPLIVILLFRSQKARVHIFACLLAMLVALACRVYFQAAGVPYPWIWVMPMSRLDPFAIGVLLALTETRWLLISYCGWAAALLGASLFLVISSFPQLGDSSHSIWQLSLSALVGGAMVVAVRASKISIVMCWRPLVVLGKLSFGLYVYHRFTIDMFVKSNGMLKIDSSRPFLWIASAAVCLLLTIIVAAASYQFFESRFLRTKERYEVIPSRPSALTG